MKRVKRQATEWNKIFVTHITNQGLVSRKYFELLKSMRKKIPIEKQAKDLNRHFTKEYIQMANNWEMYIKTTISNHYTHIRFAKLKV